MHKTTLYLPEATQRAVRELARRTGRPQAEIVRRALDLYLTDNAAPTPRSVGMIDDPDLRAEDAKALVRAAWDRR